MEHKIETLSGTGFSALSDELFASFFTADMSVTERIINTLLQCDFRVEKTEACEVDRNRFGYYHPFVLVDACMKSGRSAIAVTHIDRRSEEDTSEILNWMLYRTALERRNIYPILISLDSTDGYLNDLHPVSLRISDSAQCPFALAVVWTMVKSTRKELTALMGDLTATRSEDIVDDDIRRVWIESYTKSGLCEMENVAYSMWLKSMESDIERLGIDIK